VERIESVRRISIANPPKCRKRWGIYAETTISTPNKEGNRPVHESKIQFVSFQSPAKVMNQNLKIHGNCRRLKGLSHQFGFCYKRHGWKEHI
jgi:hypothetical protein